MLDDRKAAILGALVEHHIETGSPVSSRAILERSGLDCSSATVRNELVHLEHAGFITKPHTSAGRIPTDGGFRYYVDHLSPGALRIATRTRIDEFFGTMHSQLNRILRETSDLLSEVTEYPAVVLGPGLEGDTVGGIHLLPVEPSAVLFVILTAGGRVHQSVLRVDTPVTPRELEAAEGALVDRLVGEQITPGHRTVDTVPDLPAPAASLVGAAWSAVADAVDTGREVFMGGTSRLASLWEDLAKLKRILTMLEHQAGVLSLLDGPDDRTSVRLGAELDAGEDDLAVVSASYEGAGTSGRMGVLGPMRMDYKRTIRVVDEVSDALGDRLNG
jgi:heat-inducible transcriptional repressor